MSTQVITKPRPWAEAFDAITDDSPVSAMRRAAFARFGELGVPTRRHEEWRYTNVKPIAETTFARPAAGVTVTADQITATVLADTPCHRLVFVNGRLQANLSDISTVPGGVRLTGLADAIAGDFALLEPHLGRYASTDEAAFTALNTAFIEDGAVLDVPKGVVLERPVHLVFLTTTAGSPTPATHPRILVTAGEASEATIVESYVSLDEGTHFTNAVTEIAAGPGAVIDHYKIERECDDALHVSSLWCYQERDSNVTSHNYTVGGRLVRHDVEATLDGTGIESTFNGLYLTRGRQHVDNHLRVRHLKPHCNSREFYKGVLDDRSSGVFTGRIYVEEDAQKTDAVQTNMNLLLTDDARVTTKPQLEIFADDVKCTHGATIGQIDESQLFYLQSRGIEREAARALLVYAFANETICEIKIEELRRRLQRILLERLPEGHLHQDGL